MQSITSLEVRNAMKEAWNDSFADDPVTRHEEGGYIVLNADGSLGVERWLQGAGAYIVPPLREIDGTYNGKVVIGEFHTHPNPPIDETGKKWTEGPSPGDLSGIQAELYPGDSYVIGHNNVYAISKDGVPSTLGTKADVLQ